MVCTIEQAKLLKKFGVKYPEGNESPFIWMEVQEIIENEQVIWHSGLFRKDSGEWDYVLINELPFTYNDELETRGWWNAFGVAELGVMIPHGYDTMYVTGEGWSAFDLDGEHVLKSYETEAECRAALLIELIRQKSINIEQCNKILTES